MKKLIFSLMVMIMATANAFADSEVVSGDVNVLRDASAAFSVEYDFSKTVVEGTPTRSMFQGAMPTGSATGPKTRRKASKLS